MDSLISYLIHELGATLYKNNVVKISGLPFNAGKAKKIVEIISRQVIVQHLGPEFMDDTEKVIPTIEIALRKELIKRQEEGRVSVEDPHGWGAYRLVVDVTNSSTRLYDRKTKTVSRMEPEALRMILREELRGEVFDTPIPAVFEYNPYNLLAERPGDLEGRPVTYFNLYQPPPWMEFDAEGHHMVKEEDVVLPPIVQEFMEHLVPDEECRRFVWSWMHFALVKRAETYLLLNGAKGVGKNLLSEEILRNLVGESNFKPAPESFLEGQFNSVLENARMIMIDEQKFGTEVQINKLKRYINERQNIEKKGVDADETITTYNSFTIQNNSQSDVYITWDDRRFSAIDLSKTPLNQIWTQKKIDELLECLKLPETHKMIGYYVLYYDVGNYTPFSVWRGPHFWSLVYTSLPEWCKVIVDLVVSRRQEEYDIREIKAAYKQRVDNGRFPVRNEKIVGFLNSYQHDGKYLLGEFELVEGGGVIHVSEHFKPIHGVDSSSDYVQGIVEL